jgi:hypothetical protein
VRVSSTEKETTVSIPVPASSHRLSTEVIVPIAIASECSARYEGESSTMSAAAGDANVTVRMTRQRVKRITLL